MRGTPRLWRSLWIQKTSANACEWITSHSRRRLWPAWADVDHGWLEHKLANLGMESGKVRVTRLRATCVLVKDIPPLDAGPTP